MFNSCLISHLIEQSSTTSVDNKLCQHQLQATYMSFPCLIFLKTKIRN